MSKSIKYKIGAIFGCFTFFILGALLSTFVSLDSQKEDGMVINLAGRQRMLTQKMAKEALGVSQAEGSAAYRKQLPKTVELFDKTLRALVSGGEAPLGKGATALLPATSNGEILNELRKGQKMWQEFHEAIYVILKNSPPNHEFQKALQTIEKGANPLLKQMNKAVKLFEKDSARKINRLKTIQILFFIGALLLAVFGIFITNRTVILPITRLGEIIDKISKGDLTQRVETQSKDEVGQLSDRLDTFIVHLEEVIQQIALITKDVASTSTNLSSDSNNTARGAETQMHQITQIAASMEQLSATVEEMASNAKTVSQSAEEASRIAAEGGDMVSQTITEMERIEGSVKSTATIVTQLGESSGKIGKIIAVIDGIAAQTNLLALNAAVEAARAGSHGKGFAVVAEEVRGLAEKTSKATKEIEEMILSIQKDTEKAVSSMEGGTREVARGVELISQSGDILEKIVEIVRTVQEGISPIAVATKELSQVSKSVADSTDSVSTLAREFSLRSGQTASTSFGLSRNAGNLKTMIDDFKTGSSEPPPGESASGSPPVALIQSAPEEFMVWNPSFSVGVEEMDTQHKKLFELASFLHASVHSEKGAAFVDAILKQLVDYAAMHFKEEEEMMERRGYPLLEDHKKKHRALEDKVREFVSKEDLDPQQLLQFLKSWLLEHIMKTDKGYGHHFSSKVA